MSRMAESELDLVVAGTADAILMVEAGAKGVGEQTVLEALEMAHNAIRQICAAQLELREQVGKEKRDYIPTSYPEQAIEVVNEYLAMRLDAVLFSPDKAARESGVDELRRLTIVDLGARFPEHIEIIGKLFDKKVKDRVRERIVEEGVRPDGRGLKDVRQISRSSTAFRPTSSSATCTTTTSRRSRSAKRGRCAVRAAARSVTERSLNAHCWRWSRRWRS